MRTARKCLMAMLAVAIALVATDPARAAGQCAELARLAPTDAAFHRPIAEFTAVEVPAKGNAPAHCALSGVIWPETRYLLLLPKQGWNGRFVMTGNGGPAGVLRTEPIAELLRRGYAAAGDSGGHFGNQPLFAFGYNPPDNSNPYAQQKLADFAYRSIHESARLSRQLIRSYYGSAPKYSYYVGASQGGRQGLKNAQLYPDDFDGWVVGYPVINITNQTMTGVLNSRAVVAGAGAISPAKLALLAMTTLRRCDAVDGVADGLIADPRACDFQPARDLPLCADDKDRDDCFTPAQAEGIAQVYRGPRSTSGKPVYFGTPVGSEIFAPNRGFGPPQGPVTLASLWRAFLLPADPARPMTSVSLAYGDSYVKYLVLQQPNWDWRTGELDNYEAVARARGIYELVDALNPDLHRVAGAGKKIIQYHGWADALVTPFVSVDYYERVNATLGEKATHDFYRLFMIPGMGHGPSAGPSDVGDWLGLMEDWVERGKAPERLTATRPAIEALGVRAMTRPLCPYPQQAAYSGHGSSDDAASFKCVARNSVVAR